MNNRNEKAGPPDSDGDRASDSDYMDEGNGTESAESSEEEPSGESSEEEPLVSLPPQRRGQGIEVVEDQVAEIDSTLGRGFGLHLTRLHLTKVNSPGGSQNQSIRSRRRSPLGLDQRTQEARPRRPVNGDREYAEVRRLPVLNQIVAPPQRPVHGGREYAEVEVVVPQVAAPPQAIVRGDRGHHEVQLLQVINTVQLPHGRDDCPEYPFVLGNTANNLAVCPLCWCRICEVPTVECREWSRHCDNFYVARRGRNRR
jgi:hypothetical protein